ncbi:MAG TPA: N-acyl homoserine lactonase family protein [Dehalococcoidia bacterium]|nr:N-acyl homoserine lactonase family protein [Dehalococcoidia bacterium]
MSEGEYRIYAIQYARRETNSSECFYGDYRREPMTMAYYVWALRDGQRTIVVDLGFTEPVGTRRGRTFTRGIDAGLSQIGVEAASVEDVIVTHFHYDHTGNHALFPQARFHVQAAEMAFCTGPFAGKPAFSHSAEPDDIAAFVRYNYAGRVRFVQGEADVAPGVRVHHVGGHTAGMQIVSVQTARGTAVLTSDASHYYANYEQERPFNTLHDLPGTYRAFTRIRTLASAPELIVPGHDPLVLERLQPLADGIVTLG